MSSEKNKVDIDMIAKKIASELLDKMKAQDIFLTSNNTERANDCAPSGVKYTCDDKDCSEDFDCHPAKKFECKNKFTG